ncbi:MAG: UDP-N-acetylmuramate--L-alanine ligase [Candidatus Zixiibacteriota bacterium]|nr:MAG: UDP-N-acetylmuramate--L-alanine ligase [candidate division Zixibacteria bacterium]
MFGKIRKLFFVGIGGAGMSGIAEILHNLGFEIRGSDCTPSDITAYLDKLGMDIYDHHGPENLGATDVVVISSAVGEDNPEVIEARRRGIPVIKRAEMLGELMRMKFSIGVAGTHGKTTTTSMIGKILQMGRYQPTIIVGGVVAELGTGAALDNGEYLVAEADEYDRSFLSMFPSMAVVTNLEEDHLDCYDGVDDLVNSFLTYMNRVPFYGSVIISADDERLTSLRDQIARPYVTFGFSVDADYRALKIKLRPERVQFAVYYRGDLLGEIVLRVPGRHNVANALAAVAACRELDVPFETIADGLRTFSGVSRRFEIVAEINDIMVVDDYAHHPTEIAATLNAAREVYDRRLIVIYQPHLFSRTRDFADELAEALALADKCLLADIYPAREKPIEGVTSQLIVDKAQAKGIGDFKYIGPRENAADEIATVAKPRDMVIIMGAGSITLIKHEVMDRLRTL